MNDNKEMTDAEIRFWSDRLCKRVYTNNGLRTEPCKTNAERIAVIQDLLKHAYDLDQDPPRDREMSNPDEAICRAELVRLEALPPEQEPLDATVDPPDSDDFDDDTPQDLTLDDDPNLTLDELPRT